MPTPKPPQEIDRLALGVLAGLSGRFEASALVLGGAFALRHYLDYRDTHDLDAWWVAESTATQQDAALDAVRTVLRGIAASEGLLVRERAWGDVQSLELAQPPSGKTIFSVQVAARDRFLEAPLPSAWPPLQIETLADALASKMNALVHRGAPRDMLDLFMARQEALTTEAALWDLWRRRNPDQDEQAARAQVRHHLAALEARRPLADMLDAELARAGAVRTWLRDRLAPPRPDLEGDHQ